MSEDALASLAREAGVAATWKDVYGETHQVAPETLRAVLAALSLPAGHDGEARDSLERLRQEAAAPPSLATTRSGEAAHLPGASGRARILLEDGGTIETAIESGGALPAIEPIGYHHVELADRTITLAVAPARAWTVREACGRDRAWGLAVQLYALRRERDGGLGDFAALAEFARTAAGFGADAVAISPVHAQFSADPDRFSPYAPSSRAALNVLHAPVDYAADDAEAQRLAGAELVDWPAASRLRLAHLRAAYRNAMQNDEQRAALAAYRHERGTALEAHARFEALHAAMLAEDPSRWNWRHWPEKLRDPGSTAVHAFAQSHADEVALHAWLQLAAERGLASAQHAARAAGMAIGIVADLAVGADAGGSQAWARQDEILGGMTIGAPPDMFQKDGQAWGISAFSPRGLRQRGFSAFIDMLRSALGQAGGVRIDHAMGLARLWVVPDGASAAGGTYLTMPQRELFHLLALESRRHRAIVLAEDLGTVPDGFQPMLAEAGILGMRVLWFERNDAGNFTPPAHWTPGAAAMTSTHDLPTVAGWWRGNDIDWRERAGTTRDAPGERWDRGIDRDRLWRAFCESGSAAWPPPPNEETGPVADAACAHVGGSACELVMLPVEDALGLVEQPNLPGTIDEHPNWRRRLPAPADTLLQAPAVQARLAALARGRGQA